MSLAGSRTELSYAVRAQVVFKYWGHLCVVSAVLSLAPLGMSLFSGEFELCGRYLLVILGLASAGLVLSRLQAPRKVQQNEALVIVALAFLTTPLSMTWPMMGAGLSFVDALFEAVSGVTTTGLSTAATVNDKPTTFLFARAWMQWYAGLGVVVLALAIVVQPGILAKRLALGEVDAQDPVGGTRAHFRRIVSVYLLLTVVGSSLLFLLGVGPLDSLLYSFAAVSTGGYAPRDASLAALPTVAAVVTTILCAAAALSLVSYHRAYRDGPKQFFLDRQFPALILLMTVQSVVLFLTMRYGSAMPWSEAAWHGPMMAVSAQSTAGFSTTDVNSLDPVSKGAMIVSMFIGGAAGSTAGGVKLLRLLVLFSLLRTMLLRTTMPARAVVQPRLGRSPLDEGEIREAFAIISVAACVVIVSWLSFMALGHDPLNSLFEVASATGTVGLSAGLSGPDLHAGLKLVLCGDMLLGRLEIFAWLVLVYPRTWFGRRKREATLEVGGELRGHVK